MVAGWRLSRNSLAGAEGMEQPCKSDQLCSEREEKMAMNYWFEKAKCWMSLSVCR